MRAWNGFLYGDQRAWPAREMRASVGRELPFGGQCWLCQVIRIGDGFGIHLGLGGGVLWTYVGRALKHIDCHLLNVGFVSLVSRSKDLESELDHIPFWSL